MGTSVRRSLTDRQANLLVSALSIAAADKHNLDWLNRVVAGSKAPTPTSQAEINELFSILNRCEAIEVTGDFK